MGQFAGLVTDEGEVGLKKGGSLRFMDAGIYDDCEIVSVEIHTKPLKDPTWVNLKITMVKEGFHPKMMFMIVPTASIDMYAGKKDTADIMLSKLSNFFNAIGLKCDSKKDVIACIGKCFGDKIDALAGCKISITLGYRKKAHSKYIGKDMLHLVDTAGNEVLNADGDAPLVFASREALQEHAFALFGPDNFAAFADIVSIKSPTMPNNLSGISGKKPAGFVIDDDDVPF